MPFGQRVNKSPDTEVLTASMADNEGSRPHSRSTIDTFLSDCSENPLSSDSEQKSSYHDTASMETTWPSQNPSSAYQTDANDIFESDSTDSRYLLNQDDDNSQSSPNFLQKQI
ncbi:MAG: hypothetical protein MHMPM18_004243, partial [Marteilia pararefringens]